MTMKMLVDAEWLARKVETDPDADCEAGRPACINHPDRPMRENLDGENLCQECCDVWVRGEGVAALEQGNG